MTEPQRDGGICEANDGEVVKTVTFKPLSRARKERAPGIPRGMMRGKAHKPRQLPQRGSQAAAAGLRADEGIGPYKCTGECTRSRRKFSMIWRLTAGRTESSAPTGLWVLKLNFPVMCWRVRIPDVSVLHHQADDLAVGVSHAGVGQRADGFNRVLDAGFDDAVPGVELVAAAVHMIAEQPRIHAGRNLGRAGGLSSVADDAGCDRHGVDERVLDANGKVDVEKVQPITFDPFNNTYVALGKIVGTAFSDGKELK